LSVFIPIPIGEIEREQETPSLTYRLDLNRGRIIGRVDGIEAVKQFIMKALITPRFRCIIYDNQYGSELKETVIAKDASREYVETEIPRLVKDALFIDSRILDIYDFTFSFEDDSAFIKFTVNTIFGETVLKVVV